MPVIQFCFVKIIWMLRIGSNVLFRLPKTTLPDLRIPAPTWLQLIRFAMQPVTGQKGRGKILIAWAGGPQRGRVAMTGKEKDET